MFRSIRVGDQEIKEPVCPVETLAILDAVIQQNRVIVEFVCSSAGKVASDDDRATRNGVDD
jgi:hypothetical protein